MPIIYSFAIAITTGKLGQCEHDLRDIDHYICQVDEHDENTPEALNCALRKYLYEHKTEIFGFLTALTCVGFEPESLKKKHKKLYDDYKSKFVEQDDIYDIEDETGDKWVDKNIDVLLAIYSNFASTDGERYFKSDFIIIPRHEKSDTDSSDNSDSESDDDEDD